MNTPASSLKSISFSDPVLADLMDQFANRFQAGDSLDIEDFLRAHPERAEELRHLLPAVEVLAELERSGIRNQVSGVSGDGSNSALTPDARPMTPDPSPLGDFRIIREVGRGGMGIVYEAEQISLGRRIALKVLPFASTLDSRQLQRFRNEAHAAAQLHHTNIVPVFATGCERGVHFYAMQFIDGQTLAEVVRQLREKAGLENRGSKMEDGGSKEEQLRRRDLKSVPPPVRDPRRALGSDPTPTGSYTPERPAPQHHRRGENASTVEDQCSQKDTLPEKRQCSILDPESSIFHPRSSAFYRTVADLGQQVAEALDHAHEQGIIHRDIKPSNLILEPLSPARDKRRGEGAGVTAFRVWVTDFGLAHIQKDKSLTMTGDLIGTLRYMSPEQALAKRVGIDHRTDIYSLGVTLYELLTLQPPFSGEDRQELLGQIAFEEPRPLRRINRSVPTELETIVLKAIEKNPTDRYSTAKDLADDLGRFLDEKPIRAKRPTLIQSLRKWTYRHKAIVTAAFASALAALAFSMVWVGAAYNSERKHRQDADYQKQAAKDAEAEEARQRAIAENERDAALGLLYDGDMQRAQALLEAGTQAPPADPFGARRFSLVHDLLEAWRPQGKDRDFRGWEWYYSNSLFCQNSAYTFPTDSTVSGLQTERVFHLSWSPEGNRLASAGSLDGSVDIWDLTSEHKHEKLRAHRQFSRSLAWFPDGKSLITGAADDNVIRVWNPITHQQLFHLDGHRQHVFRIALSPNGGHLVSWDVGGPMTLKVWDMEKRKEILSIEKRLTCLADWSPDGKLIATAEYGPQRVEPPLPANQKAYVIRIWNPLNGQDITTLPVVGFVVHSIAWSPNGKLLACAGMETIQGGKRSAKVLDISLGKELFPLPGAYCIAWSPNGQMLACPSSADEKVVKVWSANTGKELLSFTGHLAPVTRVAWSPDSRWLASSSPDTTIKVWDVNPQPEKITLGEFSKGTQSFCWSPDGRFLALGMMDGQVKIWDKSKRIGGMIIKAHDSPVSILSWSGDGNLLLSGHNLHLRVWETDTGREKFHFDNLPPPSTTDERHHSEQYEAAWDPKHDRLAVLKTVLGTFLKTESVEITVFESSTEKKIRALRPPEGIRDSLHWSPDGRLWYGHYAYSWDTNTWDEFPIKFSGHVWGPDGRWLAGAVDNHSVTLINMQAGTKGRILREQAQGLNAGSWHPNGNRLACLSRDGAISIWDTSTGQEVWKIQAGARWPIAWNPKGDQLASLAGNNENSFVRISDASSGFTAPKWQRQRESDPNHNSDGD